MNQTKQARLTYKRTSATENKIDKMISDIIFKHVKDLVFIMKVEDREHFRYFFANENGMRHAGMEPGDIGKTLEEVLPFSRAHPIKKHYQKAVRTGEAIVFYAEVSLEQEQVLGETLLTPISAEDGEIQYVVAVTRTLQKTSRKSSE